MADIAGGAHGSVLRAEATPGAGASVSSPRRLPVGAEFAEGVVHFRLWAPRRKRVEVVIESGPNKGVSVPLAPERDGYFSGQAPGEAGVLYRFRLDGGAELLADPASRFQPDGPHGPSQVVDPAFPWTDRAWKGPDPHRAVVYEMHVGTFTAEGRWWSAEEHLPALRDLGATIVEVMPVADFPGRFGWGYDGVNLFAPTRLYGRPDDFRHFVDHAHRLGLGVILDVVYNHLGPDGNRLTEFSDHYFTDRYECEWGQAINFDGPNSEPVRDFMIANARYWIEEFHLDGLRLDATQQIFDSSPSHVVAEIAAAARDAGREHGRSVYLVAENEPQDVRVVRPSDLGGFGLDAMWNDDFHHSADVSARGQSRAYLSGYRGSPQEFISLAKHGFLYQGQRYKWQGKCRGTPTTGLEPDHFVNYVQNHDQIANTGRGDRIHATTSPGRLRVLTTLLILTPGTPMLFQGQEFAASSRFTYFADHKPDLARLVRKGRTEFVSQFPNLATSAMKAEMPTPDALATFRSCVVNHSERLGNAHAEVLALHRDLIRLRALDPVFSVAHRKCVDGAILSHDALVLRYTGRNEDRLLLVNFGYDLCLESPAEPLLAAPIGAAWRILWSSEHPRYGGTGTPPIESDEGWFLPAHSAVVLTSA
ncbi:MAG TPA: malto-oligosyltrehalose trehalohydrolase [Alphaproteobacteria bacterium]|nr:malto-oligosyltrehalose trehalohydrolase [Alphaproteobacteria bacterium]